MEKPIYGALTLYRTRGTYLKRLEQFSKSIHAYDSAQNYDKNDVRTLLGRSVVRAKTTQFQGAIEDAERAAALEPENLEAAHIRAQALYEMCCFEESLVHNYRGYRRRKMPPVFSDGINQCIETLEDCVGENAGDMFKKLLPTVRRMEAKRRESGLVVPQRRRTRLLIDEKRREMSLNERMRHETLSRVMAQRYLGRMATDKQFLCVLRNDPRLDSANASGSKQMRELSNDAYEALVQRQDVLRTRRPYYTVQAARERCLQRMRRKNVEFRTRAQEHNERAARDLIGRAREYRWEKQAKLCMDYVERTKIFIYDKSIAVLPCKDKLLSEIYDIASLCYIDQKRLSPTMSERDNERRVAFVLWGAAPSRESSRESVLRDYPVSFLDPKKQIGEIETRLETSAIAAERCYLLHELARLLCDQRQYNLAKFHAKRCQAEADIIMNPCWSINACFLLVRANMLQSNRADAKSFLEDARVYAENYKAEQLLPFINMSLEMVTDVDYPDTEGEAGETRRARQIVRLMVDERQREDAKFLFKRMSVMPASRRFSIMPGATVPEPEISAFGAGGAFGARRASIMPAAAAPPSRPLPTVRVPGLQEFDL